MRMPRTTGALLAALVLAAGAAGDAAAAPAWRVDSLAKSTAAPGTTLTYLVQMTNVGDADADTTAPGQDAHLTGTFPSGLSIVSASPLSGGWDCSATTATTVSCTESTDVISTAASGGGLSHYRMVIVTTEVDSGASGTLTASFELDGGGATTEATTVDPTRITTAPPEFGVDAFDGQVTADAAGTPFTQAGGHPYAASTSIDFNTLSNPLPIKGQPWPVEPVKDVFVDLPPGFVGDPTGTAQCTLPQLANAERTVAKALCPPTSQVGTTVVRLNAVSGGRSYLGPVPVFNMVPPADVPARFGFNVLGTVITLDAALRSATDYGLSVNVRNISEGVAITGTSLTFWGVPADSAHDLERACSGQRTPDEGGPTCSTGAPRTAFLRNPTSCTVPGQGLPTTIRTDSWVDPGDFKSATFVSHLPDAYPFPASAWGPEQGPTGCAKVPFDPTLTAAPTSPVVAQPTGFAFDVSLPQSDEPRSIGQGDLDKAVVTLPLGVRVSPSSAAGLAGCSPAQLGLRTTADPSCPDGSKLGSLTIETPLLDRSLDGSIYLAGPHDNPFDTLLAIYLVARGPGLIVKLAGKVESDPLTGQLTATFDDNPQLPFSNLHLEFKGGPRAPLVNPPACGTYTTRAELTSWSGAIVSTESSFTLSRDGKGAPCPAQQFTPGFRAGTASPAAGESSPFNLRLSRDDEDQELGSLTIDMPGGLLGRIADAVLCEEPAATAGSCQKESLIGSVTVGAGAGESPFYITGGRAYITGPFKGAPFGLTIVVPAVAGPFNLGNVVVRAAIFVDKHTAQLRVVSDPLPTILDGIPLQVRDVRVAIDRPGFILNPTSCETQAVRGLIGSTGGMVATVSDRFQAAECRSLRLAPKLTLRVGARGWTGRGSSTPLTATLRQTPGQANLASVKVTLPTTINARLPVVNRACTREQFERGACARARAGTAVARTPLLRDPLRGNVYFVRNGHPLPDLFVALRGQVDFDLIGRVSIPGSKRLATTFDAVPDVPITSFSLHLVAGRQGPVGTTVKLCSRRARTARAMVEYEGQNGRRLNVAQRLRIRGCGNGEDRRGRN